MLRHFITKLRHHFRHKRYDTLAQLLDFSKTSGLILDLGGGPASFFAAFYPKPQDIVLVEVDYDLAHKAKKKLPHLQVVVADGEHLPFASQTLHATVCNSVIEHVNNPDKLAAEIQRVSQSYFVQTPNVQFPVETHSYIAIPFYNQIPIPHLQKGLCKLFGGNFKYISSVSYLSEQKLRSLFPQAIMRYEKSLGLKKSFYLIHTNKDST
jgi:ubiquinone/menaquinone biosynthesis C-methylase UbiE